MSVETSSILNRSASEIPREASEHIQMSANRTSSLKANLVVVGFPNLTDASPKKPHLAKKKDLPEIIFTSPGESTAVPSTTDVPTTTVVEANPGGNVRKPMGLNTGAGARRNGWASDENLSKNPPQKEDVSLRSGTPEQNTMKEPLSSQDDLAGVADNIRSLIAETEKAESRPSKIEATHRAETISLVGPKIQVPSNEIKTPSPPVSLESEVELDPQAIGKLVDKIMRKYPPGATGFIGFASCDDTASTSAACAAVAERLAQQNEGQILLIDGELNCPRLSEAAKRSTVTGLKNLMMRSSLQVDELLLSFDNLPMDFLPAGNINVKYWLKANERLQNMAGQISSAYRFVCISLGNAHEKSTKIISSICDGVYLFVSMKETSRVVAESATQQFFQTGTPVFGCVVSDVAA